MSHLSSYLRLIVHTARTRPFSVKMKHNTGVDLRIRGGGGSV